MVCNECPPSMLGREDGPSYSYSSFTIKPELGPEGEKERQEQESNGSLSNITVLVYQHPL